jgi:hypothetical protein
MPADVDDNTATLICKFQWLFKHLKHKHTPVNITPDNYCFYWGWVSKSTSSAMSLVHFGHWKAVAKVWMLVDFLCTQLNQIAQTGSAPSRWGVGLQVLLEKVPGMSLVDKLQAVLLMDGTSTSSISGSLVTRQSTNYTKCNMFQMTNTANERVPQKTQNLTITSQWTWPGNSASRW